MTSVVVRPGRVSGSIRAPPSKSYTHRALVAGHLARRRYAVINPLDSDDTRATARALEALGSRIRFGPQRWTITPSPAKGRRIAQVDCGESGTTLRFAAALAALSDRPVRLRGRGRLPQRPLAGLFDALESLGASCQRPRGEGNLPATVHGPLRGGAVRLSASVSSQFVSALLLVLPVVPEDSTLELVGPVVSEPYIEATLAVLQHHRIRCARHGRRFSIPGGQRYLGSGLVVPGDASSAAYFWTAAAITGGRVQVTGIPRRWPQADLSVLDLLRSAGATVRRSPDGATVGGGRLRGFRIDLTGTPDLYPLAGVLAASMPERSRLQGAAHVVLKESDRRAGTRRLATAMGAEVRPDGGGMAIRGRTHPRALRMHGLSDHRLVMSAGVAALVGNGPSRIADSRAVTKSFPGFWESLSTLQGRAGR